MFLRNNTRAAAAICHHFRSAVTSGLSWLRAGGPRAALIQIQARVVASGGEPEPCVLMLTHLSPQHGALQGPAAFVGRAVVLLATLVLSHE